MTLWQVLAGVGVVLALEGLAAAVAPGAVRRAWAALLEVAEDRLRAGGLAVAALGTGLAWALT